MQPACSRSRKRHEAGIRRKALLHQPVDQEAAEIAQVLFWAQVADNHQPECQADEQIVENRINRTCSALLPAHGCPS